MPLERRDNSEIGRRLFRRRDVLTAGVASAGLLLAGCGSRNPSAEPTPDVGWIDAHTHVWTDDVSRFPVGKWVKPDDMAPRSFTAEDWLREAAPAGVRRAVLVQHSPYYGNDSSYLIDCRRRYPGTFAVIGRIDPHEPDLGGRMRRLVADGVKGLRISPTIHGDRTPVADPPNWLKSDGMRQLWKQAAENGVAICPILTPDFLPTLRPMCAEFSAVRCVIDHLGQVDVRNENQIERLVRLSDLPNVYVKVSAFYKFGTGRRPYTDLAPLIRRVLKAFGASRLMWGSDCPYQLKEGATLKDSSDCISRQLDFLSGSDRRAILHDTADQLFFA